MKKIYYGLAFTLITTFISLPIKAQAPPVPKKQLAATRLTERVTIDGKLDEAIWQSAAKATDFIQDSPNPGQPSRFATEVSIAYDDAALYVAAQLHDPHPDSLIRQLTPRDDDGFGEAFSVNIDAYQGGVNGFSFGVTGAGVQTDYKITDEDFDAQWNAVWQSAVQVNAKGWAVEMRIPYSALRFAKKAEQVWNINFYRSIGRFRESSNWNKIRPDMNGYFNQAGELVGIQNINPPTRLFFYPYVSGLASHYSGNGGSWSGSWSAGADIKYGINDALTLDMTLVPDFTQVRSDNQVLNLSPFEVQFQEQRQFFTEGTELFNRANMFYSRRIGGFPSNYYRANDGETVLSNPESARLLNSSKLTGRLKSGLAIGVLNSITQSTHALVRTDSTGETREVLTEPLTNYNITVLDQALKNNSYVSLINANTYRFDKDFRKANVTGVEADLRNKSNSYKFWTKMNISQIFFPNDSVSRGYLYEYRLSKTKGAFRWSAWHLLVDKRYDRNDLGYLAYNNFTESGFNLSYSLLKPYDWYNRINFNLSSAVNTLASNWHFQNLWVNAEMIAFCKDFTAFGLWTYIEPQQTFDYFEPREDDFSRYYRYPFSINFGSWVSTNYAKPFAFDGRFNWRRFDEEARHNFNAGFSARWRANAHVLFIFDFDSYNQFNDIGFVNKINGQDIIFGRRVVNTVEDVFTMQYAFTPKMSLSFRARDYWSRATYNHFFYLNQNGNLEETTYTGLNEDGNSRHNANFHAFTIDCVYRWQFLPGSELSVVWKNNTSSFNRIVTDGYGYNLVHTFDRPQNNTLSVKVLYFLDYLTLKKLKKTV